MTIGKRIKTARKQAGMTQAALASKMGISYQGIQQWENDRRNPRYSSLLRIAKALNIPIQNLFSDSDDFEDPNILIFDTLYGESVALLNSGGYSVNHVEIERHTEPMVIVAKGEDKISVDEASFVAAYQALAESLQEPTIADFLNRLREEQRTGIATSAKAAEKNSPSLTDEEQELVDGFRGFNRDGQVALLNTVRGWQAAGVYIKRDLSESAMGA